MDRHLIAVEVSVERRTYERVELDGSALYEYRLECLYTQTVERRSSVEHYGVVLDDVLESVPYLVVGTVDELSCGLDICDCLLVNESLEYERLEELECHLLRETALVHLQLRSYDDNRTS